MLTLKKISENTGLQYDKRLKMAFGRYQGYEVSILQTESAAQLLVTFWVKRHDGMPVNPEELWQTSSLDKKIKLKFSYTGHSLRIQMMPKAFSGGVYKHLESFLENFTDELREKQYVNCCNECGAESQLFQCQTGQSTQLLCDTCYAKCQSQAAQAVQETASKKSNMLAGLVGAFVGSLIGVGLWVIIYQMGYISAVCGIALSVFAFKGYEKFSGKLDKKGIIATCILCIIMVYFAQKLSLTTEIYLYFQSETDINFFDAYSFVSDCMEDPEIRTEFYSNLAIGYLLSVIGSFSIVRDALVKLKTQHTVNRLQEPQCLEL